MGFCGSIPKNGQNAQALKAITCEWTCTIVSRNGLFCEASNETKFEPFVLNFPFIIYVLESSKFPVRTHSNKNVDRNTANSQYHSISVPSDFICQFNGQMALSSLSRTLSAHAMWPPFNWWDIGIGLRVLSAAGLIRIKHQLHKCTASFSKIPSLQSPAVANSGRKSCHTLNTLSTLSCQSLALCKHTHFVSLFAR